MKSIYNRANPIIFIVFFSLILIPFKTNADVKEDWFINFDGVIAHFVDVQDGMDFAVQTFFTSQTGRSTNCVFSKDLTFIDKPEGLGRFVENYWINMHLLDSPTCQPGGGTFTNITIHKTICKEGWYFENDIHECALGTDPEPECRRFQDNDPNAPAQCIPVPIPDEKKNAGECDCQVVPREGNPVHIGTGNKFKIESDYQSPVQNGLRFRRYYNTQGTFTRAIGEGWFADYWQRFTIPTPGNETIEARRPDGRVLTFYFVNNQWISDIDVVETLEEINDAQGNRTGWRLKLDDDSVEEYEDFGSFALLTSITDRNGFVTSIVNDLSVAEGGDGLAGTPDLVTDPFGRELRFAYAVINGNLQLEKMIDPEGNEYLYTQDTSRRLTAVIYPDETPADPNDNPSRFYHYEDINFPSHLTGITNENGNRFATYAYDGVGRAILSEHAGGAESIAITYNADGTSTVTDSQGSVRNYEFTIENGMVKIDQINGGPCPNCSNQAQNITYDTNGFIASQTDFNGNLTTFIRDAQGLELSRTEAVGTPEERTITTTWHPDFRLPLTITEPGKVTTFTYDAVGRLLERKEEVLP